MGSGSDHPSLLIQECAAVQLSIVAARKPDFSPCGVFGHDRGLAPRQLDLALWPRGSVQEVLAAYFRSLEGLSEHTITDYRTRERWLLRALGPATSVEGITVETLARLARHHGPDGDGDGLMYVTIFMRYKYLRAACEYAVGRKVLRRDDVPTLPKLPDDGRRLQRALTLHEFRQLRLALQERFRRFADGGHWTGQHSIDLESMPRSALEPNYIWTDDDGEEIWRGRYLRKNHKVPSCPPLWLPMEPEFREAATEWLREPGAPSEPVIGRLWAKRQNFNAACDAAGIERCTPNRDMRRTFASMLLSRGYCTEYVRHALGHLGPVKVDGGMYAGAGKGNVGHLHYFRMTEDLIRRELRRRKAEAK